jgi:hypothetical protein
MLAALAWLVVGSQARGVEVNIQGSVVCNGACIPDPKKQDHGLVVFAIDGTAEVRATVELIMKDFYADNGLDAKPAQKLMDQFSLRRTGPAAEFPTCPEGASTRELLPRAPYEIKVTMPVPCICWRPWLSANEGDMAINGQYLAGRSAQEDERSRA